MKGDLNRAMKYKANKGVASYILELLKTHPKGIRTVRELLPEVVEEYPNATITTVGNALCNLRRKELVAKFPSVKGRRGSRWGPIKQQAPRHKKPLSEKEWSPEELGAAVISILFNMKKRIKEQNEKIDQLLNTMKNRQAAWSTTEQNLRSRILDQNKIIESLRVQLEPDPDLVFKLAEVANFMEEKP